MAIKLFSLKIRMENAINDAVKVGELTASEGEDFLRHQRVFLVNAPNATGD